MGEKKNIQLSVIVITYNEEKNIEKCLASIKWADEIIVVDAYSTYVTVELAKKYTNKIYLHKFSDFATQRNYALQYATGKWILMVDADEVLVEGAEKIIRQLVIQKEILGYWLPRRNYINGRTYLKHGYFYPDSQLKLYANIPGLKYEGSIHAQPVISQKLTKALTYPILYHNPSHSKYNSFFSFRRFLPYIKVEGKEMAKTKKSNLNLFIEGISESIRFVWRSFIKTKGYKDGYPGLRAALIYGMYILGIRIYALYTRFKE